MTKTASDIKAVSDAVLDFEYLKILRIMKPYITCIMNSHYIELIRHWLEKLSESNCDKIQRNVYLFQLGRQIEDGDFAEPFLDAPTDGPLKHYQEQWGNVLDDDEEILEENKEEEKVLWQYFPFTKSSLTYTAWNDDLENTKRTNKFFQQLNSKADDDLHELESSVIPKLNNMSNDMTLKNQRNTSIRTDYLQSAILSPVSNINQTTENSTNANTICCNSVDKLNEMREKLDKFEANVLNIQQNIQGQNMRKRRLPRTTENNINMHNNADVSTYVAQNPDLFRLNLTEINRSQSPLKRDEESSWYDMSEESTNITCQGSGDAPISTRVQMGDVQTQKVTELLEIIDELRRDNFMLGHQLEKCTKYSNAQNSATELSIQHLVEEVGSLKNRLKELLDIKSSMQTNHLQVSANLKSNIANLHKKLKNMQKKNQDLKLVVTALESQLKDEHDKNKKITKDIKTKVSASDLQELEQKLTDTISKKEAEIAEINAKYEYEVQQKQNDFQLELFKMKNDGYEVKKNFDDQTRNIANTYENKIVEIRDIYERNIADMKNEFRKELNCKESEIERLELLVQDQCGRMRNEVQQIRKQLEEANKAENEEHYLEKIEFLQKCILKMEKLYLKSEKDYHKQLSKLRKDLELRDKQNQLQLHTQKASSITSKNASNVSDVDEIINKLEHFYKCLILKQQEQATDERRSDAKIILDLRRQLLRFSSICDIPERA